MYDLSKLFYSTTEKDTFYNNIEISNKRKEIINKAKSIVKEKITLGIREFTSTEESENEPITPKFHTQGSFAYKTVNKPCFNPPQQVDYDYGTYLPLSYMENDRPSIASKKFFEVVDDILLDLTKEYGWKCDTTKKNCCRVIIDQKTHIDVPLYSIPDKEFAVLTDRALARGYESFYKAFTSNDQESWLGIDSNKILLAVRDEGWRVSDPLILRKWFLEEVAFRGEQFRRICKYLKAWRDFQWEQGGPSSIFLMVCASKGFKKFNRRDDLALEFTLDKIPEIVAKPVTNPKDDNEVLSDRISEEDLEKLSRLSWVFKRDLSMAIEHASSSEEACDYVIKNLGDRFPKVSNLSDLVVRSSVLSVAPEKKQSIQIPRRIKAG